MQPRSESTAVPIRRTSIRIIPDSGRVLINPFKPSDDRKCRVLVERILKLTETEVENELQTVLYEFKDRHLDLTGVLGERFHQVAHHLPDDVRPSHAQRLLIGGYFMSEYALESAALFNPSIVPHPDQSGMAPGSLRIVVSLRATGEGHISSIEFRCGTVDAQGNVNIDPAGSCVTPPLMVDNPTYFHQAFRLKLHELGIYGDFAARVIEPLGEKFTRSELLASIHRELARTHAWAREEQEVARHISWVAESNYEIHFNDTVPLSQRVIFPQSPNERQGIEDARFVMFTDDDGNRRYFATYTAWDGEVTLPQLIETHNFIDFRMLTLNGRAVRNKGMALFPRKVNGQFAMLSRQDDENLFLMFSDSIYLWRKATPILKPEQPWEFVKIGNCGSPIETEAGWVVLTHGVGPMRRYCIGAVLLDLEKPSKVLGRLQHPLIEPDENEREGYVPNVVYTCGSILHAGRLIIPYAMSDYATTVASVSLDDLLAALLA